MSYRLRKQQHLNVPISGWSNTNFNQNMQIVMWKRQVLQSESRTLTLSNQIRTTSTASHANLPFGGLQWTQCICICRCICICMYARTYIQANRNACMHAHIHAKYSATKIKCNDMLNNEYNKQSSIYVTPPLINDSKNLKLAVPNQTHTHTHESYIGSSNCS